MIRYTSQKQLRIEEFSTPFEQNISSDNRWVKLSKLIPWDNLAGIYFKALVSKYGRPSIDARRIIGSIIIKHKLNLSDEETVMQIQENPYLQYFCGYTTYEIKPIFSPTLFVEIRKRLGQERFTEMQDEIIATAIQKKVKVKSKKSAQKSDKNNDGDKPSAGNGQNGNKETPKKGKLLMDATVAEQQIKYPTDLELLNDARQICEKIIDLLYPKTGLNKKPRTYRRLARKDFLAMAKQKRKSANKLRKAIRKQLNYILRNIKYIDMMLDMIEGSCFPLPFKYQRKLWIIRELYRQQKQMHDARKHSCHDRIVSIYQPHVRPIVRGKARHKTEFGAKIGTSMIDGLAVPETISWDAYNESSDLIRHVENYYRRFGFYPEAVLADNIYGTQNNRTFLQSKGIRFAGKPLGRPKKMTGENQDEIRKEKRRRKQEYRDRIPIEGKFGQGKNGYNLNKIRAKLQSTSESWICSIFFVMNIVKLASEKNKSFFKFDHIFHFLFENRFYQSDKFCFVGF